MAKEDILLRATTNAPLTTKGSALTFAEFDANWIEIYNALVSLSQSSNIPAYSASITYDDTLLNYVSYSGQIWKMVNVTPQINVTPGTDPTTWLAVYATDIIGKSSDLINKIRKYKIKVKQNAPVATTTDPTMVAGQIWTLDAYDAADSATIAALEKISGTLYAVGSKYRSSTTQTLSVAAGTTLSYDGAPYIVSTDINGDFNPFVNTIGEDPSLDYVGAGGYTITTVASIFLEGKTIIKHNSIVLYFDGLGYGNGIVSTRRVNDTTLQIYTSTDIAAANADEIMNDGIDFEIEIYP